MEYKTANVPPPKLDIKVITAARAAYCHLAPDTPKVDPELKANQPHHKTKRPWQVGEEDGNGFIVFY